MFVVTLMRWHPGFVANRLIQLLRDHGYRLADAHAIASDFAEGQAVAVQLPDRETADRFADDARALGIDVAAARIVGIAG